MKCRFLLPLGLAAVLAAALSSCAAGPRLTSSWADSSATATPRTYQTYAVVAITQRAPRRRMFEDMFVNALAKRGVTGVSSYTFYPDPHLDKEAATAKLQEIGADAVFVTRLVDQQSIRQYYPGVTVAYAAPSAYYGDWYGYYALGSTYTSTPGYMIENKVYRLETNLYDVQNEKLLWTGLTEATVNEGETPRNKVKPIIAAVLADLQKKGLIPAAKK